MVAGKPDIQFTRDSVGIQAARNTPATGEWGTCHICGHPGPLAEMHNMTLPRNMLVCDDTTACMRRWFKAHGQ